MSDYLYKPKNFKNDIPIRDRTMDEKAFIIQQIKKRAYNKKHCMEVLGFSKNAWLKYSKHAKNGTLPLAIGQPPRINQENAENVARTVREKADKDDAILLTSHEGGSDVTLRDMLQEAADKSYPKKTGKALGKKTVRNFKKQFNIVSGTAAARTEARHIAGTDVRTSDRKRLQTPR